MRTLALALRASGSMQPLLASPCVFWASHTARRGGARATAAVERLPSAPLQVCPPHASSLPPSGSISRAAWQVSACKAPSRCSAPAAHCPASALVTCNRALRAVRSKRGGCYPLVPCSRRGPRAACRPRRAGRLGQPRRMLAPLLRPTQARRCVHRAGAGTTVPTRITTRRQSRLSSRPKPRASCTASTPKTQWQTRRRCWRRASASATCVSGRF